MYLHRYNIEIIFKPITVEVADIAYLIVYLNLTGNEYD